jgi:hypothetical protein
MSAGFGDNDFSKIFFGANQIGEVFFGNTKVYDANAQEPQPVINTYLEFSSPNEFSIKTYNDAKNWDGMIQYSTNGIRWRTWTGTTVINAALSGGEYKLLIAGTGNTKIAGQSNYRWVLTGSNIACSGNIESLLDHAKVTAGQHPSMADICFAYMFSGCTGLTAAPALPAITLANNCYGNMFDGCTGLTAAPALPATIMADSCYWEMFKGCSGLTAAPALPATKLEYSCYFSMFSGCTSLTAAPALPATTLMDQCYNSMFSGCTGLTAAPALPATKLGVACYLSMFSGCSGLTAAPALPATTLAHSCYLNMFDGCTSLTAAPALPATTLAQNCYSGMFMDCTNFKVSSTKIDIYTKDWRIPKSGSANTATGWSDLMLYRTGGTFKSTPSINTTYYVENDPVG